MKKREFSIVSIQASLVYLDIFSLIIQCESIFFISVPIIQYFFPSAIPGFLLELSSNRDYSNVTPLDFRVEIKKTPHSGWLILADERSEGGIQISFSLQGL